MMKMHDFPSIEELLENFDEYKDQEFGEENIPMPKKDSYDGTILFAHEIDVINRIHNYNPIARPFTKSSVRGNGESIIKYIKTLCDNYPVAKILVLQNNYYKFLGGIKKIFDKDSLFYWAFDSDEKLSSKNQFYDKLKSEFKENDNVIFYNSNQFSNYIKEAIDQSTKFRSF